MLSSDFIKTIVAGLLHRIQANEVSEADVIAVLLECNALPAILDDNGSVMTDDAGNILLV